MVDFQKRKKPTHGGGTQMNVLRRARATSLRSLRPDRCLCTTNMAALRKIHKDNLHVSKPVWWLESRFHFSFADYFNTENMNFGALRVMNDDLVKPGAGFGTHPHRDAEIFSYIVDGELSHQDSMGHKEALPRGCVQYLSAGTGITHSEMNDGKEVCRFIQVWLTPDRRGHEPQYGSTRYTKEDRHNKLLHILGGTKTVPGWGKDGQTSDIRFHQDANVFVSENDPGIEHNITLDSGRQAYMLCIEGALKVNTTELTARDALEIVSKDDTQTDVSIKTAAPGAHFLLIEMKQPSLIPSEL